MTRTLRFLAVFSLVGVVAVLGPLPAVQAGDSVTITVDMIIVGVPSAGAEFVVAFDCGQAGVDEFTFTEGALGPQTTFTLIGPCALSQTADGGADAVSYSCVASGPGVESCVATVSGVDIEYISNDGGGDASITVTNTFEPEPEVEDDTEAVTPPAGPVTAQPTFTG